MTNPYTGPTSGPPPQQPQPPYGQPYLQPAPQPPQGGPAPYGPVPYSGPSPENYAHWGNRALGGLIDYAAPGAIFYILMMIGLSVGLSWGASSGLIVDGVLYVVFFAFMIWNCCYRRGKTGQSLGQSAVKSRTVTEQTGQPLGFGYAFLRYFCHIADGLPFAIGYFCPLWDQKRQTFADKMVGSVVIPAPDFSPTVGGGMPQQGPPVRSGPQPGPPVQQPYPQPGPPPQPQEESTRRISYPLQQPPQQ